MAFRWRHCAMTQAKLQEPIVMCGLGRLYSKQSVIENLLEKEKMPESAKHIKSLKDIKDLKLTSNPAYQKDADKFEGSVDVRNAPYICKLIGLEMTGKFRFIALWNCGCVFSERAFKELKSGACSLVSFQMFSQKKLSSSIIFSSSQCQKPYTDEDVIILNGNDEDIAKMRTKMESRIAARKSTKKDKQKVKQEVDISEPSSSKSTANIKIEKDTTAEAPSTSGTPSTTSKGATAAEKNLKRGKMDKLGAPEFKKAKEDYSVAEDPKASDVYKSLFTSHETEQQQDRAHWVTYNPFYN